MYYSFQSSVITNFLRLLVFSGPYLNTFHAVPTTIEEIFNLMNAIQNSYNKKLFKTETKVAE